jgi:hypothetical protein
VGSHRTVETSVSTRDPSGRSVRNVLTQIGYVNVTMLADRVRRPTPRSVLDVPATPRAITPQWLTSTLCGKIPGARVDSVHFSRATEGTTTRCAAELTYNAAGTGAGLPRNVFIKCSGTMKTRAVLALLDLAANEVEFMTKLRPELAVETPQCYFGNYDRKSCRHALVLEDVAVTKAAQFCQADQPLDRGEIEDVLTLLATCHGRFWDSSRFSGDLRWFKEHKTPKAFVSDFDRFLFLGRTTVSGLGKYSDLVPPGLARARRQVMPALWRSLDFAAAGPPTLLHGDCHLGNLYRTGTGRIGMLDWQICSVGSWTFDVSYLLSACLTVENRRTWEHDLIAFYLDQLGAHGGRPPAFDAAFDAYRRGLMYPLAAWMFVLNRPPMQPDMQPRELSIELVRRMGTAIDDLSVLDLLVDA